MLMEALPEIVMINIIFLGFDSLGPGYVSDLNGKERRVNLMVFNLFYEKYQRCLCKPHTFTHIRKKN